jgi:hypothetical protein
LLHRALLVGRQQSVKHDVLVDGLVKSLRELVARVVAAVHATVLEQILYVIECLLVFNGGRAESARAARPQLVAVARLESQDA